MTFTDNQAIFTILLIFHVFGAIAGIGPTFAFSILGKVAMEAGQDGVSALRALVKINRAMPTPVYFIIQPLTGILLILSRSSIRSNFFKEEWLVMSLVAYIILGFLIIPDKKRMDRILELAEGGQMESDEFKGLAATSQKLGPVFGMLTVFIILMMIWKPLSECAGPLLRC